MVYGNGDTMMLGRIADNEEVSGRAMLQSNSNKIKSNSHEATQGKKRPRDTRATRKS